MANVHDVEEIREVACCKWITAGPPCVSPCARLQFLSLLQVVHDSDKATGGNEGKELLSAFNVATFAGEEDDAAFWDRLIPTSDRPRDDAEPEHLGIRAARLKNTEEVG